MRLRHSASREFFSSLNVDTYSLLERSFRMQSSIVVQDLRTITADVSIISALLAPYSQVV